MTAEPFPEPTVNYQNNKIISAWTSVFKKDLPTLKLFGLVSRIPDHLVLVSRGSVN